MFSLERKAITLDFLVFSKEVCVILFCSYKKNICFPLVLIIDARTGFSTYSFDANSWLTLFRIEKVSRGYSFWSITRTSFLSYSCFFLLLVEVELVMLLVTLLEGEEGEGIGVGGKEEEERVEGEEEEEEEEGEEGEFFFSFSI